MPLTRAVWSQQGKVLRARSCGEVNKLDPGFYQNAYNVDVMNLIYPKLIGYEPGREWGWQTEAAESIEQVEPASASGCARASCGPTTSARPRPRTSSSPSSASSSTIRRSRASRLAKRARAVEMLRKVRIPDPESRMAACPHQFSGGMRQRSAIAMALLVRPELLIADEPTTALDATLEVQIIHLLQELQREVGCSIMFVSHHLGVIAELCDRVVVMYAGEVVEDGAVRDVFHRPGHPYTQALLQCDRGRIKERTRNLPTIPGDLPDLVQVPAGCIFKNRCRYRFATCETVKPPFFALSEGHGATCHLLAEAPRARADASLA